MSGKALLPTGLSFWGFFSEIAVLLSFPKMQNYDLPTGFLDDLEIPSAAMYSHI